MFTLPTGFKQGNLQLTDNSEIGSASKQRSFYVPSKHYQRPLQCLTRKEKKGKLRRQPTWKRIFYDHGCVYGCIDFVIWYAWTALINGEKLDEMSSLSKR
jgi:hypothetical protein